MRTTPTWKAAIRLAADVARECGGLLIVMGLLFVCMTMLGSTVVLLIDALVA